MPCVDSGAELHGWLCGTRQQNFSSTFRAIHSFSKKHNLVMCKLFEDSTMHGQGFTPVASTLTWGSISGQRRSWPSPTQGAGARRRESRTRTDGDVRGNLLGPCQTGSHQKRLPTAGRPATSVHGRGGGWVLRRSQRQCWPVLEERRHECTVFLYKVAPLLDNKVW